MQMKIDDTLMYKDSQMSIRYGTGVVTSVTPDEYIILWSGRGLTRYKRSILDGKLEQIFQRADKRAGLPKERHIQLGTSKVKVAFNENYNRAELASLSEKLKASGVRKAMDVADGITAELLSKKLVLRDAAKALLYQVAELCNSRNSEVSDAARNISRELFFGYVLQKSDFHDPEPRK